MAGYRGCNRRDGVPQGASARHGAYIAVVNSNASDDVGAIR